MTKSAEALSRHRLKQWQALKPALNRTPALAPYAGKELHDFPVTDIQDYRRNYDQWNSLNLDNDTIRNMAEEAENGVIHENISAGFSTGSTGQRGIFMASSLERADYIGQSIARLLPVSEIIKPQRLALLLRANNALYNDVSSSHFSFNYMPLSMSTDEVLEALELFNPTILIAPPHRLLDIAQHGRAHELLSSKLKHLFYGSEPMSEIETSYIKNRLGKNPRSIYQATEGFLGSSCHYGNLHLNDHSYEIELEPVPNTSGFRPIITDLRRFSQPVVRLRGDDFIEPVSGKCRCGYSGRVIAPVSGRIHDNWNFDERVITASQVINAVEDVLGATRIWQCVASNRSITLRVSPDCPDDLAKESALNLQMECALSKSVSIDRTFKSWNSLKRQKVSWLHD